MKGALVLLALVIQYVEGYNRHRRGDEGKLKIIDIFYYTYV